MNDNLILAILAGSVTLLGLFTAMLGLILSNYLSQSERTPELKQGVKVQSITTLALLLYNGIVIAMSAYSYYVPDFRCLALKLFYVLLAFVLLESVGLTIYVLRKG